MSILQNLIPHHFLTFCVGKLASSKNKTLKNILIRIFIKLYKPDLSLAKLKRPEDYKTYNDFFIRELEDFVRPVDSSINAVCSPVDGSIVDYGLIDSGQLIQAKRFKYELTDLMGDPVLTEELDGGVFITIYLAPTDYHRIHCPLAGKIIKSNHMGDSLFSVNLDAQTSIPSLYIKNERASMVIQSRGFTYGLVAVGASIVGSIVPFWEKKDLKKRSSFKESWNNGPKEDSKMVGKGQELAYFKMGSTVILLFPKVAKLNIDSLYQNKTVKFGERLAEIESD